MDMTSMHPITAETAHERGTGRLPRAWRTLVDDVLETLLAALEYRGEWELAEKVEAELEQRQDEGIERSQS